MARYGRGKFEAAETYVRYMLEIVEHPAYAGMPNAFSNGRVNWQVSSGKGTSFNKYYDARWDWWAAKADELRLPGTGNENERFTIAARRIHPTGYRPCRLCGELHNVGYFYLNANLTKHLNASTRSIRFTKLMPINAAVDKLGNKATAVVADLFPERKDFFVEYGLGVEAFEASNFLRSKLLSPGFMANPPDRLDGFHDYCVYCRAKNDPGRSEENLRSYIHDRRAFEYWAEGDWALADELYNSAGPGTCAICGAKVDRVSPDHVGPLACGFKQQPLFVPTCQACNSAKNRRMRKADVDRLRRYEHRSGESVASWGVRGLWDRNKEKVRTDAQANELSATMRALQDVYLRCLFALKEAGRVRFLVTLLSPQYAFFSHEFVRLDRGALTFDSVRSTRVRTPLRASLACRSVRIALDELTAYSEKQPTERKLRNRFEPALETMIEEVTHILAGLPMTKLDYLWIRVAGADLDDSEREGEIASLMRFASPDRNGDRRLRSFLETRLYQIGASADLFS